MKKLVTLLLLLNANFCLQAQEKLFSKDSIYQKVEIIYKNIKDAVGDFRRALPKLVIMDRVARVAAYRKVDNTLIIERKAYNICQSMGTKSAAALAFLIGHELTHFYQQHDWDDPNLGTTFLVPKKTFEKQLHHEKEADLYGAFIAELAGYNVEEVIPLLLDRIYETYKLAVDIDNYPSKNTRKQIAKAVQKKVKELVAVNDKCNYFAALGWHTQAIQGYEYILQFVKTKELYNNIGMTLLAIVNQQYNARTYWYPLEVDIDNVLRYWTDKTKEELLTLAIERLEKAILYDPTYVSAYLNLAIAYDLQEDYDQAALMIDLGNKYNKDLIVKAKLNIVQGVVWAHLGEKAKALQLFEHTHYITINSAVRGLIAHNRRILKEGYYALPTEPMNRMEDILDGIPLLETPPQEFKQSVVLEKGYFTKATLHFNEYANSNLACFQTKNSLEGNQSFFVLQSTYKLATHRGIHPGDSATKLRKTYDSTQTARIVQYKQGYFLIYRSLGLIFKVNNQEQIEEWALFLNY